MGVMVGRLDTSAKLVNFTVSVSISVSVSRTSCKYLLHQTVKYIEKLLNVRTAIGSSLYALGDDGRGYSSGQGCQDGGSRSFKYHRSF